MNYDHKFEGPITLRHALEDSRNVPAVRVMEQLGPEQVIALRAPARPRIAAPAVPRGRARRGRSHADRNDERLFAVFPNQGVRMRPYSILKVTDREGNVLEENRPEPQDAIRADTAFVMTNLLRGVVQRGTAVKAAALELADRRKDRHHRRLHRCVVHRLRSGHHDRRLGRPRPEEDRSATNQTGAEAALPIWIDIMKAWIGDRKDPPKFEPPGNIVFVSGRQGLRRRGRPKARRALSQRPSSPARSRDRDSDSRIDRSR